MGVLVGYALGGRLAGLARLRLRGLWLLWVAAAVQAGQYVPPVRRLVEQDAHIPMLGIVFAVVAVWLGRNLRQPSRWLRAAVAAILIGASLNAAAILANGRMPYSPHAAVVAGVPIDSQTPKNEPAHAGTRLAGLGDVIPVPPLRKIVSVGDLVIGLGAASLVALAMLGHAAGRATARRATDRRTTDRRATHRRTTAGAAT